MLAKIKICRYGDTFKIIWDKTNKIQKDDDLNEHNFIFDNENEQSSNDEKLNNNIIRAKSKITEYALCNDWEYFFTLTLDKNKQDRYDLQQYVKDLGNWIQNYNKKYNTKLTYILIPEKHDKGGWHMHGLFNGVVHDSLTLNEYGYLDLLYYKNRFGYISLSPIKDKKRIAHYITKYIKKDILERSTDLNKHLYYASKGLKEKEIIFNGFLDCNYKYLQAMYSTDYCSIMWSDDLPQFIKEGFYKR